MRPIDADALGIGRCNPDIFDNKGYADGWNSAVALIENAPTIDAEPVRHGHIIWKKQIRGRYRYMGVKCSNATCGMTTQVEIEHPIETKTPYCSECGKRLDDNFMNYCPNCGAKMDGESEVQE